MTSYTIDDVLESFRIEAGSQAEKGRMFESLIRSMLEAISVDGQQFSQAWLWDEWPNRPHGLRDTGVDIVAQREDGGICAIQCKFYAPGALVDYSAVSNFKTAANYVNASQRIFVSTSDNLSVEARRFLDDPSEPTKIILLSDLQRLPLDWLAIVSAGRADISASQGSSIRVVLDRSLPAYEIEHITDDTSLDLATIWCSVCNAPFIGIEKPGNNGQDADLSVCMGEMGAKLLYMLNTVSGFKPKTIGGKSHTEQISRRNIPLTHSARGGCVPTNRKRGSASTSMLNELTCPECFSRGGFAHISGRSGFPGESHCGREGISLWGGVDTVNALDTWTLCQACVMSTKMRDDYRDINREFWPPYQLNGLGISIMQKYAPTPPLTTDVLRKLSASVEGDISTLIDREIARLENLPMGIRRD